MKTKSSNTTFDAGRIMLISSILIFLFWYSLNAYFNRYAVDDFWHGFKIQEMGFLRNIEYHFFNWEGSISHVILASLPHVFGIESKYAFVFNFITLTTLIFSIYKITILLLVKNKITFKDKYAPILISFFITNVLFLTFDNKPELLFCTWLNLSYTLGIALYILGLKFYLEGKIFTTSILFIFFAFNKINIASEALLVSIILWYTFLRNKGVICFLPILLFGVSLVINILAPGNLIRQDIIINETSSSIGLMNVFWDNVVYYSTSFLGAFLFSSLLLFPLVKYFFADIHINIKSRINTLYISLAMIFVLFESLFFAIAFNEAGPSRTKIFLEFFAVVGAIIFALNIKLVNVTTNLVWIYSLFLISIFTNSHFMKYIPISRQYSISIDNRNSIMLQSISMDNKLVRLNLAPESGILNSAWSNDEVWLNNVYRRYYTTDSTFYIQLIK